MTTDRPYRPALERDAARAEIDRLAGAQFMPGAGRLVREALAWWAAAPAEPPRPSRFSKVA
jgi:HD-GYP domain-containing protein (c-di-GMP phosphodiesterase class II)